MDNRNRPHESEQDENRQASVQNPFENNQPVEKDIEQSTEELEKEQQFKEAQTERD